MLDLPVLQCFSESGCRFGFEAALEEEEEEEQEQEEEEEEEQGNT